VSLYEGFSSRALPGRAHAVVDAPAGVQRSLCGMEVYSTHTPWVAHDGIACRRCAEAWRREQGPVR
jgi:hypothetical protein